MLIPVSDIYIDSSFNSRGAIAPIDVTNLARTIEKDGLLQPIVIRKMSDLFKNKLGKRYSLICGFRRYTACTLVLNWKEIECTVLENIDDKTARELNLIENLERKDLSFMQEVKAVAELKPFGHNRESIAKVLNKSPAWVQLREQALALPVDIQTGLDKGDLTQADLRKLYTHREDPDKLYDLAKKLKAKNLKQLSQEEIKEIEKDAKKPNKRNLSRRRDPSEIEAMQDTIRELFGNNISTRLLGWCAGYVSDIDIHLELKREAEKLGVDYQIPSELLAICS